MLWDVCVSALINLCRITGRLSSVCVSVQCVCVCVCVCVWVCVCLAHLGMYMQRPVNFEAALLVL